MQISPGLLLVVVGGGGGDLENSPFVETLEASVWELGNWEKLTTGSDISAQFMIMLTFYRLLKPQ